MKIKFRKKSFIIRSKDVIQTVNDFLSGFYESELLEVIVRKYKKDRTAAQNSLYWKWNTITGSELGWTKDDAHDHFKEKFLVHIYERDDKDYAAMINAIRKVYKLGYKEDAKTMFNQIVKLTSTTDANVKQFTEYLNDIDHYMTSKGIILPHPEDLYYEAMGIQNIN